MNRALMGLCMTLSLATPLAIVQACGNQYDVASSGEGGAPDDDGAVGANDGGPSPFMARDGACADPMQSCLAIPTAWHGPVLVQTAPQACSGAYPVKIVQKHADIDTAPRPCGCACTVEKTCVYDVTGFTTTVCSGAPKQTVTTSSAACTAGGGVFGFGAPGSLLFVRSDAGTCSALVTGRDFGEAGAPQAWARDIVTCSPASAGTQGGCQASELCTNPADDVCVVAEGELPCPAGYPARTVGYASVDDQRTCTGSCGCGLTSFGSCVDASVVLSSGSACSTGFTARPDFGSPVCVPLDGSTSYLLGAYAAEHSQPSGGACSAFSDAGVAPAGSVKTTEPTTICCLR
jgi:hypothetical protein